LDIVNEKRSISTVTFGVICCIIEAKLAAMGTGCKHS
jgi:NADH:ubiquinone oxidoreductase subunit B-like Fe-S oxidoreductase